MAWRVHPTTIVLIDDVSRDAGALRLDVKTAALQEIAVAIDE